MYFWTIELMQFPLELHTNLVFSLQFLVVKVGRVNLGSLLRSELFQHLKIAILFNPYMAPVLHPIRVFHKHVAHFKKIHAT